MRRIENWNENWVFTRGGQETAEPVTLPHTWNAIDGQDGGNDYYRGTCKYEKNFRCPSLEENGAQEVWIEFHGAANTAEVYLNGSFCGKHMGGFSAFRVNLTPYLQEENHLEVLADNGKSDQVYPQKADFTFYGGIYRDVNLVIVPKNHFSLGYFGSPAIKVTPTLSDDLSRAKVVVETWQEGGNGEVKYSLAGDSVSEAANIVKAEPTGYTKTEYIIDQPHLWNGKEDPYLYHVTASLLDEQENVIDEIETDFGLRTMEADSEKGFLLNHRSYPLCGAARHQDRWGVGNAITKEMMEEDMDIMLDMGANTVRLAHYQHDSYFYDLCDRKGMIAWVEIPYITEHMPTARENTLTQMRELILQNYNHPSICGWGLSNEITVAGGMGEDLIENHKLLNDLCHELDSTRPTLMAHAYMLDPADPFASLSDISSYNLYYGWYMGELTDNDEFFDKFHAEYPDRVVGLSEYGADANPKFQSENPQKGDYTEGYQAIYHEHLLKMWKERPYIWAMHAWNMFDFGADGRSEGGTPGQNQKGLVTFDRKIKKDAFYIYKAYLSTDPFVHICGRRYVDRAVEETEIKVYSNLSEVTLFVDGVENETKTGDKIFIFRVPVTGEHRIAAVAKNSDGEYSDEILIRHVDRPNEEYRLKDGGVLNWFDKPEEMKREGYYSMFDSMGDMRKSPEAEAVMEEMMAIARASFGDVAKKVEVPEEIRRKQEMAPLNEVLKRASKAFTDTQMKEYNHRFNQIKKPE